MPPFNNIICQSRVQLSLKTWNSCSESSAVEGRNFVANTKASTMTDVEETIKFEPKSLVIKILIYTVVLLVGAAVFMELERGKGEAITGKSEATKLKESLAEKYNISSTDMSLLETAFEQESNARADAERLSRWTYSNSVFFAFTIMTTIGKNC